MVLLGEPPLKRGLPLRIVGDFAEVEEVPLNLFAPAPGRVGCKGKIRVGLFGFGALVDWGIVATFR